MTNEQKQHLLAYLGYYSGDIDGEYGPETIKAVKSFQTDYGLTVDGDCGPMTQKALKGAIAGTMAKRQSSAEKIDSTIAVSSSSASSSASSGNSKGWKYFTYNEVKCQCGGKHCNQDTPISDKLMNLADQVREHFGKPMTITSGIRCYQRNIDVYNEMGKPPVLNSAHVSGRAIDFSVAGVSAATVDAYVGTLPGVAYHYKINEKCVHMNV